MWQVHYFSVRFCKFDEQTIFLIRILSFVAGLEQSLEVDPATMFEKCIVDKAEFVCRYKRAVDTPTGDGIN